MLWMFPSKALRRSYVLNTLLKDTQYIRQVGYGLEEKEIAKKLGLTQQAVSDRYRRAEKKLRQFKK